jgi:hypothetical protein
MSLTESDATIVASPMRAALLGCRRNLSAANALLGKLSPHRATSATADRIP